MESAERPTTTVIAEVPLDLASADPLYAQLAERLTALISSGDLQPGQQLPSESMLMDAFGISRVTVRQALLQLTRGGQLVTKRGKGTFVTRAPIQQDLTSLQGFREALTNQGIAPETELLEFNTSRRPAGNDLPSALNLPVHLRRLYKVDGEAFAVVEAYLPKEAAGVSKSHAEELAVYDILRQFVGVRIGRADVGIQCARATSNVAKELGLPPKSHILLMQRTSYAVNGAVCEHMRIYIVPERYTFRMSVPGPMQLATSIRPD